MLDKFKKQSNNILVVSDNPELSLYLKREVESIRLPTPLRIDFRYSSVNTNPSQMIEIGAESINLKASETVDWVLRQYDLVLSVHCKQIFPQRLVDNICCINFTRL